MDEPHLLIRYPTGCVGCNWVIRVWRRATDYLVAYVQTLCYFLSRWFHKQSYSFCIHVWVDTYDGPGCPRCGVRKND